MGASASPTPDKYFSDVSTDATFADASKFVEGYNNKDVGHATEFTVTGLSPVTDYYYRLRAGYAESWLHSSVNSNSMSVKTAAVPVVPVVTLLAATNNAEGSFTANWQAHAGVKVDKYILDVARDATFSKGYLYSKFIYNYEGREVKANQTFEEVVGLSPFSPDVIYYYRVRAVVGGVEGANSAISAPVATLPITGFGNALYFDGASRITIPNEGLRLPSTGWTQEMWIYIPYANYPGYIPGVSGEYYQGFAGLIDGDDAEDKDRAPFFQILYGHFLLGGFGNGAELKWYKFQSLINGAWNHLAQTYDGSRLKAYLNGQKVSERPSVTPSANIKPIKYFGYGKVLEDSYDLMAHGGPFAYLHGAMDELRIWNRPRSAEEIRNNYKIRVDKNHPDLLAYYDFNQGIAGGDNTAVNTLVDSKGAYNATLNNFTKTGATSNFVGSLKLVPPAAVAAEDVGFISFKAKWTAGVNSEPVAVKYFLDVSTDATFAEGKFAEGYNNKDVGHVAEHVVTGLSQNTHYYYRLRAGYAEPWLHSSVNSNSMSVKTAAVPVVTLLAATNITEGSFTASWVAPAGTAADKYRLEIAKDAKFANLVPGYESLAVPGNQTSWEVTGLNPDFTYYYRVKVVADGATSEDSNIISVKTLALSGLGNALNFDGANDWVGLGDINFPKNAWTKEMWIYLPDVPPVKVMAVIGNDDVNNPAQRRPFIQINNGKDLQGGYGDGKEQKIYSVGNVLTVRAWNHIAQTFDGTRLKAYVNGKEVADVDATGISNTGPIKYLSNYTTGTEFDNLLTVL